MPDVAVADAEKQLVAVVAVEILLKLGLHRVQIADHADNQGVVLD